MNKAKTPIDTLVNSVYKLLPIYEGKLIGVNKTIDPIKAYNDFQSNLIIAEYKILGYINLNGCDKNLETVILILEGLKKVGLDKHEEVKKSIFACVKFIKKAGDTQNGNRI